MSKTTFSPCRRFRGGRFAVATAFVLSLAAGQADLVRAAPAEMLTVQEGPDVFTIQFSGRAGPVGIPSWKVLLRRDNAGNIADLRVPHDSPASLSHGEDSIWPLAVLATAANTDLPATMSKGRENFATFRVETFAIAEKSLDKIVVRVGGPSKNRHYEHHRTYTFTPVGVQIEGEVLPLIDLRSVALKTQWDRRHVADSHLPALPVRTQGRTGWAYLPSFGRDGAFALPPAVKFPLEVELRLRRPTPTYVKVFFDQNFESSEGKPLLIFNDKDILQRTSGMTYVRALSILGGAVAKGQKQTFKMRYEFETRQWP